MVGQRRELIAWVGDEGFGVVGAEDFADGGVVGGGFVQGPVGFLAGFAAVVDGFAAAAVEEGLLGGRGLFAGCAGAGCGWN